MERIAVIMGKMHSGGKKNLVMEYYRNIDRTKIQFDFLCDEDSNAIPYEEIENLGGNVYLIPSYNHILKNVREIKKICLINKYKIIHSYNGTMNVFSMYAALRGGVPIRISESISMAHKSDKKTILKYILKPFSKLFVTHFAANGEMCGIWQFGEKKFKKGEITIFKTVIDSKKNRFDVQARQECRKKLSLEKNFVVGHIGRLTSQKNTLFIIDIFNEIRKIESSAKMIIIGDGDLREEMLYKIRDYKLEDSVLYLGRREDIIQFYNAMDCFILPSLYEGLPVVGVEAQCSGLPTFFSSEIPVESAIDNNLVEFISLESSPAAWAKSILDKSKAIKRMDHSNEVVNKGFDSKNEAKKMEKYYMELSGINN